MVTQPCPQCGFEMDPLNPTCPRCAKGIVQAVGVQCPACGKENSSKRFACTSCSALLGTDLANIEKRPLKEYQAKATELGKGGSVAKAIALLEEAAAFYPDDLPTRNVLIGLYERTGNPQGVQRQMVEVQRSHMRTSEQFCFQIADQALRTGDYGGAAQVYRESAHYHPYSVPLRDALVSTLHAMGDYNGATAERVAADQLRAHLAANMHLQAQRADVRANSMESVGIATGVGVGVTGATAGAGVSAAGAAVGAGVTIVSLLVGGLIVLVGVALCIISVLLIATCIGIPFGLLGLMGGVAIIAAGATIAMGGAAAGASTGLVGIVVGGVTGLFGVIAGAFTSGAALLHRSSRKSRNG